MFYDNITLYTIIKINEINDQIIKYTIRICSFYLFLRMKHGRKKEIYFFSHHIYYFIIDFTIGGHIDV